MKNVKQILKSIKNKLAPKKSVYGPKIFEQKTWLEKSVEDALWDSNKFVSIVMPNKKQDPEIVKINLTKSEKPA